MVTRMKDSQYPCSPNHQRNPLDRDYKSGVYQLPSHTMKLPHSISIVNSSIFLYICSIRIIGLFRSTFWRIEIHRTSSIVEKTCRRSCQEIQGSGSFWQLTHNRLFCTRTCLEEMSNSKIANVLSRNETNETADHQDQTTPYTKTTFKQNLKGYLYMIVIRYKQILGFDISMNHLMKMYYN